jgi:hypothetical protein
MDATLTPTIIQTLPEQTLQSSVDVIKPIDYKIKLLKNTDINILRVDSGDHYYEGKIDFNKFPNELNDPISIVEKSLTNYSTPNIKIIGVFTPINSTTPKSSYVIKFTCIQEFFTTEKEIVIDMIFQTKKEIDYINERFNEMTNEISILKSDNTELRALLNQMETKLLEMQFNGDDNASYESEESIKKTPAKQVSQSTSATVTATAATSKNRRTRDFQ